MVLLRFVFFNTRCHSQYLNELFYLCFASLDYRYPPEAAANIKPFSHYQNSFVRKIIFIFWRNFKAMKTSAFMQINYWALRKNAWGNRLSKSCIMNPKNSLRPFPVAPIAHRQRRVVKYPLCNSLLCSFQGRILVSMSV